MEASAAARYIGCVDAILAAGLYWYALLAVLHKAQEGVSLHREFQTQGSELRFTGVHPRDYSDGETAGPQVLCAPSI